MSDMPRIAIAMVTYKRTEEALRTIESTVDNLIYPKELRSWYVADDGSDAGHCVKLINKLHFAGEHVIGSHRDRLRILHHENTSHAGPGWNRALGICHQSSDFVLWLEDDWELDEPLNLVPYVKLLQEREDVGICTFRILSTGADVHTVGYNGEMFLRYDRSTQYAFSGNPYLRHARYTKHYGWFIEDGNPGEMELKQDDQYRLALPEAPQIWRPLAISVWGAWKHIGKDKTW